MTDAKLSAIGRKAAKTRVLLRVVSTREALRGHVRRLYVEERQSIRVIARQFGLSYGTVHRLLGEAGVSLRKRGGNTRGRRLG